MFKRTSPQAGATTCDACTPGFYRVDDDEASFSTCMPCVEGATCPFNTTVATLYVEETWWRHSSLTSATYQCLVRDGKSPCKGGLDAGNGGSGYCKSGHSGPKCETCEASYYFRRIDAECASCSSAWMNFLWLVVAVATTAAALGVLFLLARCRRWRILSFTGRVARRIKARWERLGMVTKAKQLIGWAQVVAGITITYDVAVPDGRYTYWVQAIESCHHAPPPPNH